jgi:hypothetical protein
MTPEEIEARIKESETKDPVIEKIGAPAKTPKVQAPGEVASMVRGFGNSLAMGYQPQIAGALAKINPWSNETYDQARDEAAALNDAAWKEHPGYYGTGYAGGTAASLLGPGAIAKGVGLAKEGIMAGRGISAANRANQAKSAEAFEALESAANAGKTMTPAEAIQSVGPKVPLPTRPTNKIPQMWEAGKAGVIPSIPAQGAARGASTVVNPEQTTTPVPFDDPAAMNKFEQLRQYLSQFDESSDKRRAAMQMLANGEVLSEDNIA